MNLERTLRTTFGARDVFTCALHASGTASCRVSWMLYRYCTWQLSAFAADVDDPSPRLLVAAQGAGGARSSRVPDVASSTGSHGNWAKFGPNLDQGWINFGDILNQFWTRFGPTRPPAHIVSGAGTPREETYTNIQAIFCYTDPLEVVP